MQYHPIDTTTSTKRRPTSMHSSSSSSSRMTANVLFAVAAVVSLRPMMTLAEGRTRTRSSSTDDEMTSTVLKYKSSGQPCPTFGCPLFPVDIVPNPPNDPNHNQLHAEGILEKLTSIRNKTREELLAKQNGALSTLETTAEADSATLTMTGFKGGSPYAQINQDRAFVVAPFYLEDPVDAPTASINKQRKLLGVFDGHATRGELVSEYVVQELPRLLAEKLKTALDDKNKNGPVDDEISTTKRVLHETFVELDKTAPADPSGGCTATVVLQQDDNIFVANAGDSQSLIGVYRKKTQTTSIVYVSREDKPSLPDERARVEAAGGYVYIPVRGTSRVVWVDPRTGAQTGLAMSRSIGDWVHGKIGVIPDPIVDVVNIPELVAAELKKTRAIESECWVVDDEGVISRSNDIDSDECQSQVEPPQLSEEEDDVYIFAVSATDGMLDFVRKEGIAKVVAHSLFEGEGPHPATACELLVSTAAEGWDQHRQGRYRDDIAISVSTLRKPATATKSTASSDDGASATTASTAQSDEL